MKRKINSFSNYKYKRRSPIQKEDIDKNLSGSDSSDEELLKNPFKKFCEDERNVIKSVQKKSANIVLLSSSEDEDNKDIVCSKRAESKDAFSEGTSNSLTANESVSFEKDDTQYRLDVLKGIFKDEYTDKELLNALNDANGLDHAVSVLVESPLKKKDFSGNSEEDDSIEKDLKTLVKKFPAYDKNELQNVLEANSFCLEDAKAAIEVFSSPKKKTNSESKNHSNKVIDFNKVVDCVVIDNENEKQPAINENNRTPLLSEMLCHKQGNDHNVQDDDVDCELSDDEEDLAMSSVDKASVLSFLDSADIMELVLVKGSSVTKAKKICSLRPFSSWRDLLRKVRCTSGVTEELLWESQIFVNEKEKMECLMGKCEAISQTIRDLFEAKSSTAKNASENEISSSIMVTKERYLTKEPSLVASGFKLKSYQLTGLNWLIAIHKRGVNGILADEMGLGKTIQAIVFLAYLIEQGENGPHLIIVPSSTCDNWKRELERWCPSIKYLHYSGSQAERGLLRDELLYSKHDFQVVLASYNIAVSSAPDRSFLRKLEFHYAVFDEAHMLKNMKSQRYLQLLRIKPRRMLMLTGTPIQNNLLELMSLLSFVMREMFAERVEGIKLLFGDTKLRQEGEAAFQKEKVEQVKRIMEPFVMRRVKEDVLGKNLPEKHEHIVRCDAPARQRIVYDETFSSCNKIIRSGENKGKKNNVGLLIELRKAANHSLLLRKYYNDDMLNRMAQKYCEDPCHRDSEVNLVFEDMTVMSDFEISRLCLQERCLKDFHLPHELIMDSGKFLYLDTVLPKMKEKGDRILLFNQFTMMMDIVEVYLQTRGYKYLRFDGNVSVNERQSLIDRFNTEEDIFIFIISTKAGGLGINLTSANVVILYDSDYNPHNDKQAEARCHRLGQTKEVNVYKLICKDTVEKNILKCGDDKIRLHEDISGNQVSGKNNIEGLINAVFGSSSTKQQGKQ